MQIINKELIKEATRQAEESLNKRILQFKNKTRGLQKARTGTILHLDGDKRYSMQSLRYYKRLGLNAIVKYVPERNQARVVNMLLNKYNPDILIITGHDAMLKRGTNFHDVYNYRNSRYFAETVKEARKWASSSNKLTIFARSMSEFF